MFYIDEFGIEEKGIDAGGIFKEFINDISKMVFDPDFGMFTTTEPDKLIYPNPSCDQIIGNDY